MSYFLFYLLLCQRRGGEERPSSYAAGHGIDITGVVSCVFGLWVWFQLSYWGVKAMLSALD